jgi:hypothetical protein
VPERERFRDSQPAESDDDVDGELSLAAVGIAHALLDVFGERAAEGLHLFDVEHHGRALLGRMHRLE